MQPDLTPPSRPSVTPLSPAAVAPEATGRRQGVRWTTQTPQGHASPPLPLPPPHHHSADSSVMVSSVVSAPCAPPSHMRLNRSIQS